MATILDKDLIRESIVKSEDREIIITLTVDQKIKMKLKGMKSGEVSIDIIDLYNQLTGKSVEVASSSTSLVITHEEEDNSVNKNELLINLNDLRSANAISLLDIPTMQKFDGIIADLIKHQKDVKTSIKKVTPIKQKKKK